MTATLTFAPGQGNSADMTRRAALEAALLERDGSYNCFYCDQRPTGGRGPIDHVTAKSRGGSDSIENLVQACRTCNVLKGNVPGWFFVFWFWGRYGTVGGRRTSIGDTAETESRHVAGTFQRGSAPAGLCDRRPG